MTFGSVDRRGRARFGSTKPNSGSQVAKKSPEIQNRGHYPPRRAAGWPCGVGRLLVRRAGIRSASRQAPTPRPEQARGGRALGRSHPGESSRGCVAAASPVRAEAGPGGFPYHPERGDGSRTCSCSPEAPRRWTNVRCAQRRSCLVSVCPTISTAATSSSNATAKAGDGRSWLSCSQVGKLPA